MSKKGFKVSSLNCFEVSIAPPKTLPCPSICFVPEYTTISAPYLIGLCNTGVAKILSTIVKILLSFARSQTPFKSIISQHGLDGVSKKNIFVFF